MAQVEQSPDQKPLLLSDFNMVVAPYDEEFLSWHNDYYGTSFSLEDLVSYRMSKSLGYDKDHWDKVHDEFHSDTERGTFTIPPYPEAVEAIMALTIDYRVDILTSIKDTFRDEMHEYLYRHHLKIRDPQLSDYITDVHMNEASDSTLEDKPHMKGEIAQSLGAVALVDDHLAHVIDAYENGIDDAYLFGSTPRIENSVDRYDGEFEIRRVFNWVELYAELNRRPGFQGRSLRAS